MVTDLFLVCAHGPTVHRQKQIRPLSSSYLSWAPGDKNSAFSRCGASSFPLQRPPKHASSKLDICFEAGSLELSDMIHRSLQSLADSHERLIVRYRINHQAIRRLQLIDSDSSYRLAAKRFAFLLCSAFAAPDMHAFLPTHAG